MPQTLIRKCHEFIIYFDKKIYEFLVNNIIEKSQIKVTKNSITFNKKMPK